MQTSYVCATRRSLLVALTLAASGCGRDAPEQRRLNPPSLVLTELRLAPPQRGVATIVLGFEITNPNAVDLLVDDLSYEVVVNGTWLGAAAETLLLEVPARASAAVQVALPYADSVHAAALRATPPPRGVAYRITGELLVAAPSLDRVPFQLEGVRTDA